MGINFNNMHAEEKIYDDCINKWNEKKEDHKYRYLILNFTENFEYIIIEKAASIDEMQQQNFYKT